MHGLLDPLRIRHWAVACTNEGLTNRGSYELRSSSTVILLSMTPEPVRRPPWARRRDVVA